MFTPQNYADSVRHRGYVEYLIACEVVRVCLAEGYIISVQNGDSEQGPFGTAKEVLKAMFETDEDELACWLPKDNFHAPSGWVKLVYGNNGYDVISDCSASVEPLISHFWASDYDPFAPLVKDRERLDKLQAHPTDWDMIERPNGQVVRTPVWDLGDRESGRIQLEGPSIRDAIDKEWNDV